MDNIGVGSVAVVMLTGFFTGAVLTLQSATTLAAFGAKGLTGRLVAISLVRELGPGTCIADAGRACRVRAWRRNWVR